MIRKIVVTAAVVVCLLAIWVYAEMRAARAVLPPAGGTNLVGFLEARAETSRVRKFIRDGKLHLEIIGRQPVVSPLSLPSGPPVYILDGNGTLIDWCGDIGDNSSFDKRWGGLGDATTITAEEAKRLIGASYK